MTTRDAFPVPKSDDPERFGHLAVTLDRLPPTADGSDGCPRDVMEIWEYAHLESYGWDPKDEGEDIRNWGRLELAQSAQIEDRKYWLWTWHDKDVFEKGGYVLVQLSPEYPETLTGLYGTCGLTPAQFIWRNFHYPDSV